MDLDEYNYEKSIREKAQFPYEGIHDRLDMVNWNLRAIANWIAVVALLLTLILWRLLW